MRLFKEKQEATQAFFQPIERVTQAAAPIPFLLYSIISSFIQLIVYKVSVR